MGDVSLTPLGITVLGLLSERSMHPYEMYQLASVRLGRSVGEDQSRDRSITRFPGWRSRNFWLRSGPIVRATGPNGPRTRSPPGAVRPSSINYVRCWRFRCGSIRGCRSRSPEMHNLSASTACQMLRIRLAHLDKTIAKFEVDYEAVKAAEKPRIFTVGADYAHALTVAEREWIGALVTDIESGEMPWLSQELLDRLAGSAGSSALPKD